ncbi:hypothetical protein GCM10020216_108360 [Nonomuraea helvata]
MTGGDEGVFEGPRPAPPPRGRQLLANRIPDARLHLAPMAGTPTLRNAAPTPAPSSRIFPPPRTSRKKGSSYLVNDLRDARRSAHSRPSWSLAVADRAEQGRPGPAAAAGRPDRGH